MCICVFLCMYFTTKTFPNKPQRGRGFVLVTNAPSLPAPPHVLHHLSVLWKTSDRCPTSGPLTSHLIGPAMCQLSLQSLRPSHRLLRDCIDAHMPYNQVHIPALCQLELRLAPLRSSTEQACLRPHPCNSSFSGLHVTSPLPPSSWRYGSSHWTALSVPLSTGYRGADICLFLVSLQAGRPAYTRPHSHTSH